jgi:hypothetical protein
MEKEGELSELIAEYRERYFKVKYSDGVPVW